MKFGAGAVASILLASAAFLPATVQAQTQSAPTAAPEADQQPDNGDIVVTAQKREESLQSVPISIQAIGTKKLDQLNISNFNQYTQLLPSVSFQTTQPGSTTVYMRGVASGGDGNHSGSLPSVGFYLDEQPITTIGGTLDIHIYDVARIESLAGPQGTLYGASSEAGTVRIITNKPDLSHFYGRMDGEVNTVAHGGQGGKVEGLINAPINASMAFRVSGFYERDAGYIDNVAGTRSFCGTTLTADGCVRDGLTIDNKAFVKKDYNESDLWGGRAALKIDLDDSWTVTPTVLYQEAKYHGAYAMDPQVGDLQIQRFFQEYRHDRFIQAALTIEGKVGNWDVTYAGAYLDRQDQQSSDYTDYAEAYDQIYASSGGIFYYGDYANAAGQQIDPRQHIVASDHFKKLSQEFRVQSPQDERLRVTAGMFYQRQSNAIHQDYQVDNLAPDLSVNGHPGTLWLTQQHRVDKDYAMFGEASFDIVPTVTLTAGGRAFIYDNSLIGFYGFGRNPGDGYTAQPYNGALSSGTGVARCFATDGLRLTGYGDQPSSTTRVLLPASVPGGPCTNLANYVQGAGIQPITARGEGFTHKLNLTWKPSKQFLLYGTWSRGFRPGGINRRGDIAPYNPDYLTNYEVGAKATLFGGKLRVSSALYQQNWRKFQFSFLGPNSFTIINNGPNARIRGIEADASLALGALALTAAGAYNDAKTTSNLCTTAISTCSGDDLLAPSGTRLPITPRFKINGTARYTVPVGAAKAYAQVLVAHQSSASSDIRVAYAATQGRLKQYTTGDLALGAEWATFSLELFAQNLWDERAQLSRFQVCGVCTQRSYIVTSTPRTIGLRGGVKF
ncbi:TonB-dependent receptor [Sphingomonas sp. BAUL-RG-20F-R05-02]|uniref:TonB-dependent receptor n=1 Tax=Sphingomonas sp. BAUL-RG-20F-R05-02 TaxID=2914830 RepID=UPI001F58BF0F|nr:TonB-dependent receptor [Sphingomonas sp. BAUL-RG-20F-R05-02]